METFLVFNYRFKIIPRLTVRFVFFFLINGSVRLSFLIPSFLSFSCFLFFFVCLFFFPFSFFVLFLGLLTLDLFLCFLSYSSFPFFPPAYLWLFFFLLRPFLFPLLHISLILFFFDCGVCNLFTLFLFFIFSTNAPLFRFPIFFFRLYISIYRDI